MRNNLTPQNVKSILQVGSAQHLCATFHELIPKFILNYSESGPK